MNAIIMWAMFAALTHSAGTLFPPAGERLDTIPCPHKFSLSSCLALIIQFFFALAGAHWSCAQCLFPGAADQTQVLPNASQALSSECSLCLGPARNRDKRKILQAASLGLCRGIPGAKNTAKEDLPPFQTCVLLYSCLSSARRPYD